jgi:hypothetical protein
MGGFVLIPPTAEIRGPSAPWIAFFACGPAVFADLFRLIALAHM